MSFRGRVKATKQLPSSYGPLPGQPAVNHYNPVRAVACAALGVPYGPVGVAAPGKREQMPGMVSFEIGTSRQAAKGAFLDAREMPVTQLAPTPKSRASAEAWCLARQIRLGLSRASTEDMSPEAIASVVGAVG